MRTDEVEPYVRRICKERLQLAINLHADLKYTDPQQYADLCLASMARAEKSLLEDAGLHDMCKLVDLYLAQLVADEKQRALSKLYASDIVNH